MPSNSGGGTAGGNLLQALAPDKVDIRYTDVDPNRKRRLDDRWSLYDTAFNPAGNADYLAEYAARTPQAKTIAGANIDWLNQYATGGYDPTKSYRDILGVNQAALGNFLMNPALNRLTRQRKALQAAAGYGGQGRGTYDALLEERIMQGLASEAVPNLLGYTTQAYGTAGQLENQNVLNRLGIIGSGEQYRQLDTPAMRYLEPSRISRADLAASMPAFRGLATEEDLNRAYYRKRSGMEKAGQALNAFQSGLVNEANQALDLYAKAYTGGALGAMGAGGGPTGGQAAALNAQDFSTPGYDYDDRPYYPTNRGGNPYASGGGFGGGLGAGGGTGGMNNQQLIQLLMTLLQQRGAS